jgi:hypothetical protein
MVMPHHYHAQIHPKMDCGSFVHSSTVKLKLAILDPADSTKNFLAIGAQDFAATKSCFDLKYMLRTKRNNQA